MTLKNHSGESTCANFGKDCFGSRKDETVKRNTNNEIPFVFKTA
jgi:hypothetical protein